MLWMILALALATAPPTERPVAIGVGGFFNAGGTFMTQPRNLNHPEFQELPFSGWGGFSPGGGFSFDLRVKDAIGLEVDVIRSIDTAQSKYGINGTDVFFTARVPSWHVPILLKGGIPAKAVSPVLFVGVEVVIPGDIDLPQPEGLPWQITAQSETYMLWMFGLGFEGRLPIENVDIRVPFHIRGSVNAPYPDAALLRADYDIENGVLNSMEYDLSWQYHAGITLGLSYYFL